MEDLDIVIGDFYNIFVDFFLFELIIRCDMVREMRNCLFIVFVLF